jgi:glycosyltransferase involved in cell wall biosynthesis
MVLPAVTIVTPVYNGARYLEQTLVSVLEQSYPSLEYIVVDDGSTDCTAQILQRFGGRVTVLSQANAGESTAVNVGVAAASNDLVCVVNADDPILPGLLEAAVEILHHDPSLVAAYPDWRMIDAEGETITEICSREYDYRMMLEEHYCIPGPGTVFRRSAFAGETVRSVAFPLNGDFEAWLRLGLKGPMQRVPQVLACWRRHAAGTSMSSRSSALANARAQSMACLFTRADLTPEVRDLKGQAMSAAYYNAAILALHDRSVPARRYLLKSLVAKAVWPKRLSIERQRSWKLMVYLMLLPLSGPLKTAYARYLQWRGIEHQLGD